MQSPSSHVIAVIAVIARDRKIQNQGRQQINVNA